ncbi:unnamed protein product [Ixodes hexagonus]
MTNDGKREERRLPYQDSRRSWVMALVCCWCFFWGLIVNRCGGIVFVTMISEMNASREMASWPFSLLGTVSHLVGLVWGALVKRIPLRTVAIAGSLLAASGILFCVVFYNVTAMIIGLGVITALQLSLVRRSAHFAMRHHFDEYRASGMGLCYAGGTLVSFVFPPLLLYLHETYGLRGTLLILSACSLNVTAGCLLANRPSDQQRRKSPVEEPLKALQEAGDNIRDGKSKGVSTAWREELSFLKNVMYFVVVATGIVCTYTFAIYVVTIVDFAIGKGFSKWEAALLLPSYGAGDFLGRIFSGQLSDRKILERRHVMSIAMLGASAALVSLVHADSLPLLGAASFLLGVSGGSTIILITVLLAEYFGLERLAMAIGVSSFTNGIATFPRPLLIGFYRDRGKSYEGLYILLSMITFGASVTWSIECLRQWMATRRRKKASALNGGAVSMSE